MPLSCRSGWIRDLMAYIGYSVEGQDAGPFAPRAKGQSRLYLFLKFLDRALWMGLGIEMRIVRKNFDWGAI